MCLILIAWRTRNDLPLVVAANRDEFHDRPTAAADQWAEGILAGKDLQSGGTWLGITPTGRFAAVTNFRDGRPKHPDDLSRGLLVTDFLRGDESPEEYLREVAGRKDRYAGFGLFVSDLQALGYFSNRDDGPRVLPAGYYGLSNLLIDNEWPKVQRGKAEMQKLLAREADPGRLAELLLTLLADRGDGPGREQAIFVLDPIHGTRSSTVVILGPSEQMHFSERSFSARGQTIGTRRFQSDQTLRLARSL